MRDYHPKYSELPKDLYEQVKAVLKGYDRLKRDRLDVLHGSPPRNGMPSGSEPGNPTEHKAIKLAYIDSRLEAVDQAAVMMRGWFGEKVELDFDPVKAFWNYNYYNYKHARVDADSEGPSRRSWIRYKHRFAAAVALNLKIF